MSAVEENLTRVREGILANIAGKPKKFSDENASMIAVFSDPVNKFSAGRVLLFQQFFWDHLGVLPVIVKEVPSCLKIYMSFGEDSQAVKEAMGLIDTEGFRRLCNDVNVSHVQIGSKIRFSDKEGP